eukprot:1139214-Pelagomonas_calceolata.AAC.3
MCLADRGICFAESGCALLTEGTALLTEGLALLPRCCSKSLQKTLVRDTQAPGANQPLVSRALHATGSVKSTTVFCNQLPCPTGNTQVPQANNVDRKSPMPTKLACIGCRKMRMTTRMPRTRQRTNFLRGNC